MKATRKQITFDLDTNIAKEILGSKYNHIYDKIQRYLEKRGFVHIEGSVYKSKEPISSTKVKLILTKLKNELPYLDKCVRDIRQTSITSDYSLNKLFNYDGTAGDLSKANSKVYSKNELENIVNQVKESKSNESKIEKNIVPKNKNERSLD